MHGNKSKSALFTLLVLVLSACSSTTSVLIESGFPSVVSEPADVHCTLVFDEEFRTYVAQPSEGTTIHFGTAQVELLTKAFQGLFRKVDVTSSRAQLPPGTELVVIPSVRQVQLSSPDESYLNVYEVWIKYNLEIETADGVPIDSWFLPAYGKTADSMMTSRKSAIEDATIVALRDAGAKLLLDFFRIPAVHGWMEEQKPL